MTEEAPGKSAKGRLGGLLKLGLAALVMVIVARIVPWSDTVTWTSGERAVTVAGSIEGPWNEERVTFVPDAESLSEVELPGEVRATLEAGGPVVLTKDETWSWQAGMPTVFGGLRPSGLALAFACLLAGILLTTTRWWRLLAIAECPARWIDALRLTFLGFFFNIVFPGLTGGDVVKAVLVARENPERRARAVVSVFVDRLIGLFALAVLGAAMVVLHGDLFAEIRTPVIVCVLAGILGLVVYSSGTLRRLVRFDAIVARLPGGGLVAQVDEAALIYSRRPGEMALALLLSVGNHMAAILSIIALGRAFGEETLSFTQFLAIVAVGNIVSAIPVAPGGWGVGEAVYVFLFEMVGASPTIGFAVSVTFRLCLMVLGLFGGLFLLMPGGRAELAQIDSLRADPQSTE